MQKINKFHHSVTENGNIQVRIQIEYQDDEGNSIGMKYGEPFTPSDINDMDGWDDRSKDIVKAITDSKVKSDFVAEKQEPTGIGLEEITTTDRVIDEDSKIAVRKIIRIFDDGEEVSKRYHRSWIMPGDSLIGNDVISTAIAIKLHTPDVIADFKIKSRKMMGEV